MSRRNTIILDLVIEGILLLVPLFFIVIILPNIYESPTTTIVFSSAFAFMFWFILEQIFLTKLKEYRRIIIEAGKIIRAHNQQIFKKQLSRLYEGGPNII